MWKPLNLSGQGSLGGRLEQTDYIDVAPPYTFLKVLTVKTAQT
jgi:maltoporin